MACNCVNDRNIGPERLVRSKTPDWVLLKEEETVVEVVVPNKKEQPPQEKKEPERKIKFL